MDNSNPGPPVRIRRRPLPRTEAGEQPASPERLIADSSDRPRKKRLPNRGSFKKGEPSRNPKGRPKGARGKKAIVRRVLEERVQVRLPSGTKKLSVFEALVLKERDLAFGGDWRARKTVLELGRWAMPEDVLEEAGVVPVTNAETDRAILEWFEDEVREKDRNKQKSGK